MTLRSDQNFWPSPGKLCSLPNGKSCFVTDDQNAFCSLDSSQIPVFPLENVRRLPEQRRFEPDAGKTFALVVVAAGMPCSPRMSAIKAKVFEALILFLTIARRLFHWCIPFVFFTAIRPSVEPVECLDPIWNEALVDGNTNISIFAVGNVRVSTCFLVNIFIDKK